MRCFFVCGLTFLLHLVNDCKSRDTIEQIEHLVKALGFGKKILAVEGCWKSELSQAYVSLKDNELHNPYWHAFPHSD